MIKKLLCATAIALPCCIEPALADHDAVGGKVKGDHRSQTGVLFREGKVVNPNTGAGYQCGHSVKVCSDISSGVSSCEDHYESYHNSDCEWDGRRNTSVFDEMIDAITGTWFDRDQGANPSNPSDTGDWGISPGFDTDLGAEISSLHCSNIVHHPIPHLFSESPPVMVRVNSVQVWCTVAANFNVQAGHTYRMRTAVRSDWPGTPVQDVIIDCAGSATLTWDESQPFLAWAAGSDAECSIYYQVIVGGNAPPGMDQRDDTLTTWLWINHAMTTAGGGGCGIGPELVLMLLWLLRRR